MIAPNFEAEGPSAPIIPAFPSGKNKTWPEAWLPRGYHHRIFRAGGRSGAFEVRVTQPVLQ